MNRPAAEEAAPISTRRVRLQVLEPERPKTRGDCVDGIRPCPWVSCRHHLFLDVTARGFVKLNFGELLGNDTVRLHDMNETCSLDVADRGGTSLEDVGAHLNATRQAVHDLGSKALERAGVREALAIFVDDERRVKRRAYYETDGPDAPDLEDEDPDEARDRGARRSPPHPLDRDRDRDLELDP